MNETNSVATRQELVALDTFADKYGSEKIFFGFDGKNMWISTNEDVQYHIDNYNPEGNFTFGLDIEKKESVKGSLQNKMSKLQRKLCNDDWKDYRVSVGLRVYSNLRPRIPMRTLLLQKSCQEFNSDDAVSLEKIIEKHDYQIIFLLRKIIWKSDEVLLRKEHAERLDLEHRRIKKLRQTMSW